MELLNKKDFIKESLHNQMFNKVNSFDHWKNKYKTKTEFKGGQLEVFVHLNRIQNAEKELNLLYQSNPLLKAALSSKREETGYDVYVFNYAKLKQAESKKIEESIKSNKGMKKITLVVRDGEGTLESMLETIKGIGNGGHSFNIVVDPEVKEKLSERTFYWDGDGSDSIKSIDCETIIDESKQKNIIIGKTKSGKDVYDSPDHLSHGNFTEQDHWDAAKIHKDKLTPIHRAMGRLTTPEAESHRQSALKKRKEIHESTNEKRVTINHSIQDLKKKHFAGKKGTLGMKEGELHRVHFDEPIVIQGYPKPIDSELFNMGDIQLINEDDKLDEELDSTFNIDERKFSEEQREKLAKKGDALPDGSFPIVNAKDLENAIHLAGLGKNKTAAKDHIIKRAKSLGKMDMIPDNWK